MSKKSFEELIPIENGTKKYTSLKAARKLIDRGRAVIVDGRLRICESAFERHELTDDSQFHWHPKPSAGVIVMQAQRGKKP